ncbi:MAG TPA: hypothetical protein VK980_07075 [Sphingomonas sp.]|nr:hypothetical protein [Sphingomonas sp.]
MSDIGGTVARGVAWALVTLLSLLLGGVVAFGPIMLLPGPVHTDLVNGHWVKVGGLSFALGILLWRMAPLREERRFSLAAGATFIRVTVFAFALAFWPLGLLTWINGYGTHEARSHDMLVTGTEETHIPPASTPVANYRLRELGSSWTADMEITDENQVFVVIGRCVRIEVVAGRLGLDWISDAQPIPCPRTLVPPLSRRGGAAA